MYIKSLPNALFFDMLLFSWKGRQDWSPSLMDYTVEQIQAHEHKLLFSSNSKGDKS